MNIQWYDVVTAVCLVLFTFYLIAIIKKIFFSSREESIRFFREYKKGRFALAYVTAYPLALIACIYGGETLLRSIFISFKQVVELVVLKYDYSYFTPLQEASLFFNVTLHVAFVMIAINTLMFTLSLIGQYLSQSLHMLRMNLSRKDKLYILGDRDENKHIYFSEKSTYKLVIGNLTDAKKDEYYMQKIFYHVPTAQEDYVKKIVNGVKKGVVTVVINTWSSKKSLDLCLQFQNQIKAFGTNTELMKKLRVFVFGDPELEEIYFDIISHSNGCIHYINKYQQIAMDFIDKYPITSFMNSSHIDYKNGLIKEGVDINVILLGFGNTNKQIFLSSVANNQFLTGTVEKPVLKMVDYYVFDKEDKDANKNLNHNYNRFKNEMEGVNKEDYLPLPSMPANKYFSKLDINSPDFYREIRKIVKESSNSVNVITVALGSDLQNIDLAKKLCMKIREWSVDNCTIFVKSGSRALGSQLFEGEKCYFIGDEKAVFNVDDIVGDKFTKMSLLRDCVYGLESLLKSEPKTVITAQDIEDSKSASERSWYLDKTQFERESNLYCCLSLRAKLNMLGLDCVPCESEREGISESEFMRIYAGKDMPDYNFYNMEIDGKKVIKYNANFRPSTRNNLAQLEHYRWNSFMITKGFIPASKQVILTEKVMKKGELKFSNGKNYTLRRHGNLTTFEGLKEFAQMIAQRDGISLESADVISYDYQTLDDAYWLINKVGMKIVKIYEEQKAE